MSNKNIDLNTLGQVIDTSFTRSGTNSGPVLNTCSIKAGFLPGEKLRIKVTYSCFVNMVRDREMVESKSVYEKEGDSYIDAAVKQIAKEYKELADSSIKLKRSNVDTVIEVVNLNTHNKLRTVLFRRIASFEVT